MPLATVLVTGALSSAGYGLVGKLTENGTAVVGVDSLEELPIDYLESYERFARIRRTVDFRSANYCNRSTIDDIVAKYAVVSHVVFAPTANVGATKILHCLIELLESLRRRSTIHFVALTDGRTPRDVTAMDMVESTLAAYGHLYRFPLTSVQILGPVTSSVLIRIATIFHQNVACRSIRLLVSSEEAAALTTTTTTIVDPRKKRDVIFTSYFTSNADPQRAKRRKANRFQYMKDWYDSVHETNLSAVVFHDDLDTTFVSKLTSNRVAFHRVPSLAGRSTNDARFYAWYDYLLDNPDVDRVLLTDISDVTFQKNPFDFMNVLNDDERRLFVGQDIDLFPNMETMGWVMKRLRQCYGDASVESGEIASVKRLHLVYNAGVIGGSRRVVLPFLERVTRALDHTPPSLNCNMPAVNYVIHKHFDDYVYTGYPLTSRFMRYQVDPRAVYIVHK